MSDTLSLPRILGSLPALKDEELRDFAARVKSLVDNRATQKALRDRAGRGKVHFTGVMGGAFTACGLVTTGRCVATPEVSGVTCSSCLRKDIMGHSVRLAIRCRKCLDNPLVPCPRCQP